MKTRRPRPLDDGAKKTWLEFVPRPSEPYFNIFDIITLSRAIEPADTEYHGWPRLLIWNIGRSSKGRTMVFGTINWGSNPCLPAILIFLLNCDTLAACQEYSIQRLI
jgi:hypothetical protein